MVGSKVYGDLSNSPSADVAVSYAYKNMVSPALATTCSRRRIWR